MAKGRTLSRQTPAACSRLLRGKLVSLSLAWMCCFAANLGATDFSGKSRFFTQLSTSMTSVQDGKPFREALFDIAGQVDLNVWLDRKVDPTSPVNAGPVGPTVAEALKKIASQQDCVIMPIANVVLIGRPNWVDATAAALMSFGTTSNATVDLKWEALTTPTQALALAAGKSNALSLPHDLWPAVDLKKIDRPVAVTIVLAQFDLRLSSSSALATVKTEPAGSQGKSTRRYSFGPAGRSILAAMRQVDRNSRTSVQGNWLEATGSAQAHRAATHALLDQQAKAAKPNPGDDKRTFELRQTQAPVKDLLNYFAKSAGRRCVIRPEAQAACETIITIEAKNATLAELVQKVAGKAGVVATWNDDEIVVSP